MLSTLVPDRKRKRCTNSEWLVFDSLSTPNPANALKRHPLVLIQTLKHKATWLVPWFKKNKEKSSLTG